MSLYAMGDLHLSLGVDKPMDVFGGSWEGYVNKIAQGLSVLKDDDVLLLCGDTSWGMNFEETRKDFAFLSSFPGKKILLKGNHDYWWTTAAKMRGFFQREGFHNIDILHNNAFRFGRYAVCGTRGWFFEEEARGTHDEKVFLRECIRLESSLRQGLALLEEESDTDGKTNILVFLHYPPLYEGYRCDGIVDLLGRYGVRHCYYGHLHGPAHRRAVQGLQQNIKYTLISSDFVDFNPVKIL